MLGELFCIRQSYTKGEKRYHVLCMSFFSVPLRLFTLSKTTKSGGNPQWGVKDDDSFLRAHCSVKYITTLSYNHRKTITSHKRETLLSVVKVLVTQLCLTLTTWAVVCQTPLSNNTPGKNTGVGIHSLLQGIFQIQRLNLRLLHYRRWLLYTASLPFHNFWADSPIMLFINTIQDIFWFFPLVFLIGQHAHKYFIK